MMMTPETAWVRGQKCGEPPSLQTPLVPPIPLQAAAILRTEIRYQGRADETP